MGRGATLCSHEFFFVALSQNKIEKNVGVPNPLETQNHIVFGNYKKTTSKAREVQFYQNHISQILTHYTKSEASWHPIKVKSPTKQPILLRIKQQINLNRIFLFDKFLNI